VADLVRACAAKGLAVPGWLQEKVAEYGLALDISDQDRAAGEQGPVPDGDDKTPTSPPLAEQGPTLALPEDGSSETSSSPAVRLSAHDEALSGTKGSVETLAEDGSSELAEDSPEDSEGAAPTRGDLLNALQGLFRKAYELSGGERYNNPHVRRKLLKEYNAKSLTELTDEQIVQFTRTVQDEVAAMTDSKVEAGSGGRPEPPAEPVQVEMPL
jgi:hypothetical protein